MFARLRFDHTANMDEGDRMPWLYDWKRRETYLCHRGTRYGSSHLHCQSRCILALSTLEVRSGTG